jgi:hypothetical protein
MRTTLDIPDELFRQAKAKAALEGLSLKDVLTRFVENGLREANPPPTTARQRSKLPVIKRRARSSVPDLTPALQARFQEEEDLAKLRRSFGR